MDSLKSQYYNSDRIGKRKLLKDIANATDLSEQTVYHKMRGSRKFNFLEREKIAQIFSQPIEELFPISEDATVN